MASRTAKLLPLAALLFMASAGSAANLTVQPEDEDIWMNNQDTTINGEYECRAPNDNRLSLFDPEGAKYNIGAPNEEGEFSFDLSEIRISEYGEYQLVLDCKRPNATSQNQFRTETRSVYVKRLFFQRLEPTEDFSLYSGESFSVKFNASNGRQDLDISRSDFEVKFLDGKTLDKGPTATTSGGVSFQVTVPGSTSPGRKALVSRVEYKSDSGEVVNARTVNAGKLRVTVKRPWKGELLNRTPRSGSITYSELSQNVRSMSVRTKITKRGTPVNTLSSDDFFVTVRDENGNVVGERRNRWLRSEPGEGEGVYNLELKSLPNLDFGKYTFDVGVDQTGKPITNFTVYNYITLGGRMTDASGKPVQANIVAERDGLSYQFMSRPAGEYEGKLLPGTYNFTIDFPQATLSVTGVELTGDEKGTIRFDDIPLNDVERQSEGVKVLNAVSVVFGYPFKDASLSVNYDPSQVNFQNVRVFECANWNFRARNCFNEFESLDIQPGQVSPTSGLVSFPMTVVNVSDTKSILMNSYLVVRNTEMELESVDIGSDRVPVGDEFSVSGRVETPSGDAVTGADITVSLLSGGEIVRNVTTQTAGGGSFGTQVAAPDSKGIYRLRVTGSKKPFTGFSTEIQGDVETFIQREISVQAPETIELFPGETTETSITVLNSGQAPLEDVAMRIDGLRDTWYTFRNSEWTTLSPGESQEATLRIQLPGDYCEERCKEYPKFRVEGVGSSDGNKINDIVPVQSVVTKEQEQGSNSTRQQSQREQDERAARGSNGLPGATAVGEFLATQSSLNVALGLMIVFTLALAGAVKHKKTDSGGRDRGGRMQGGSGGAAGAAGAASGGSRPQVSKPDVNTPEQHDEESGEQPEDNAEEADSSGEGAEFKCSICGEEFETDSARELHENAVH